MDLQGIADQIGQVLPQASSLFQDIVAQPRLREAEAPRDDGEFTFSLFESLLANGFSKEIGFPLEQSIDYFIDFFSNLGHEHSITSKALEMFRALKEAQNQNLLFLEAYTENEELAATIQESRAEELFRQFQANGKVIVPIQDATECLFVIFDREKGVKFLSREADEEVLDVKELDQGLGNKEQTYTFKRPFQSDIVVHPDTITEEFFRFVLEAQVSPTFTCSNLQEVISKLDGSKPLKPQVLKQPEILKKINANPANGTKCCTNVLYYLFLEEYKDPKEARKAFKILKFQWQRQALTSVGKRIGSLSPEQRDSFDEIISNSARSAKKLHSIGGINPEELKGFETELSRLERTARQEAETAAQGLPVSQDIPMQAHISHLRILAPSSQQRGVSDRIRSFQTQSQEVYRLDYTPTTVKHTILTWISTIGYQVRYHSVANLPSITEAILSLPPPKDSFWDDIPLEHIQGTVANPGLMNHVSQLISLYSLNIYRLESEKKTADIVSGKELIILINLLAIQHRLICRCDEMFPKEEPLGLFELQTLIRNIINEPSGRFVVDDYRAQVRCEEILDYYGCSKSALLAQEKIEGMSLHCNDFLSRAREVSKGDYWNGVFNISKEHKTGQYFRKHLDKFRGEHPDEFEEICKELLGEKKLSRLRKSFLAKQSIGSGADTVILAEILSDSDARDRIFPQSVISLCESMVEFHDYLYSDSKHKYLNNILSSSVSKQKRNKIFKFDVLDIPPYNLLGFRATMLFAGSSMVRFSTFTSRRFQNIFREATVLDPVLKLAEKLAVDRFKCKKIPEIGSHDEHSFLSQNEIIARKNTRFLERASLPGEDFTLSDPFDEVIRVLSYCLENPAELDGPRLEAVTSLIFKQGRLLVQDLETIRPLVQKTLLRIQDRCFQIRSKEANKAYLNLALKIMQFYTDAGFTSPLTYKEIFEFIKIVRSSGGVSFKRHFSRQVNNPEEIAFYLQIFFVTQWTQIPKEVVDYMSISKGGDPEKVNQILNLLAEREARSPVEWEGDYPRYTLGDKVIDFSTKTVRNPEKEFSWQKHPKLCAALQGRTYEYHEYPDRIEFELEDGDIYQVILLSGGQDLDITREFLGNSYRFMNSGLWADDESGRCLFEKDGGIHLSKEAALNSTEISGYSYGARAEEGLETKEIVCTKVNKNGKEYMRPDKLAPAWRDVLVAADPKIQERDLQLLGTNETLETVCMHRLGLEFTAGYTDERPCFYLAGSSGFFVIPKLKIPHLKNISEPYICVANREGEVRVIFTEKRLQCKICDGELHATDPASKILYAHLLMKEGRWKLAIKELTKAYGIKAYSKQESQLLEELLASAATQNHHLAPLLTCKIYFLRISNTFMYPADTEITSVEMGLAVHAYIKYLKSQQKTEGFKLSLCEEEFFLGLSRKMLADCPLNKKIFFSEALDFLLFQDAASILRERELFLKTGNPHSKILKGFFEQMKNYFLNLNEEIQKQDMLTDLEIAENLTLRLSFHEPVLGDDALESSLIKEDDFFTDEFASLYALGKRDPEKLKKILRYNTNSNDQFYLLLVRLVNAPKKYPELPSSDEIKSVSEQIYNVGITKRMFSGILTVFLKQIRVMLPLLQLKKRMLLNDFTKWKSTKNVTVISREFQDSARISNVDENYAAKLQAFVETFFYAEDIGADSLEETKAELTTALGSTRDLLYRKKLEEELQNVDSYEETVKPTRIWKLKQENLSKCKSELENEVKKEDARLKISIQTILLHANACSFSQDTLRQIGYRQKINLDDLKELSICQNLETVMQATGFKEEDAMRLMTATSRWLVESTRLQQMKKALKLTEKLLSAAQPEEGEISRIAEILMLPRAYSPSNQNTKALWFEYNNAYFYRKEQLEKIDELEACKKKDSIAEMPTGYGKTKAIIPSMDAKGKLSMVCSPASLEIVNTEDLQEQVDGSTGKPVSRITFDRNSKFTLDSLDYIYRELQHSQNEGIIVNLRSESLRALQSHFVLTLSEYDKSPSADLEKKVEIFSEILSLILNEGFCKIDEVHLISDPLDIMIYTIGTSEPLPGEQWDFFELFFSSFIELCSDRIPVLRDNESLISDDDYSFVVDTMCEKFAQIYGIQAKDFDDFKSFVEAKEDCPSSLKSNPYYEEINQLKGTLSLILKESLRQKVGVDYGFSIKHFHKKKEFAIAYEGPDEAKETEYSPSQYKNPHETIIKTYLLYFKKGLKKEQALNLLKHLQNAAFFEYENAGTPLGETEADEQYRKIFGDRVEDLHKLSDDAMKSQASAILCNPNAIQNYIRRIISQQVRVFPEVIQSTAQNFRSQTAQSIGFSASPPDPATHGPDTELIPMKGTSGQVTHLLLSKIREPNTIHMVPGESSREIREAVIGMSPNYSAVIDVGAQLRGVPNRQVAEEITQASAHKQDFKGEIFFDEETERFMFHDRQTGSVVDFLEGAIDPKLTGAFYDQQRTTGSDLKRAMDAVALLVMGEDVSKADAGQAAGRMRELHLKQGTHWAIPSYLKETIFEGRDPSGMDLLVYMLKVQADRDAQKNYQSQIQEIDNEIHSKVIQKLLAKQSIKSRRKIFRATKHLLILIEQFQPSKLYEKLRLNCDTIEMLKLSCQRAKKTVTSLSSVFTYRERKTMRSTLDSYIQRWTNGMALPNTVASTTDLGLNCHVQEQIQTETETQTQQQLQQQMNDAEVRDVRKIWHWPEDMDLFSDTWGKPSSIRSETISKIAKRCLAKPVYKCARYIGKIARRSFNATLLAACFCPFVTGPASVVGALNVAKEVLRFRLRQVLFMRVMYRLKVEERLVTPCLKRLGLKKEARKGNDGCSTWEVPEMLAKRLPKKYKGVARFFSPKLLVSNNMSTQETESYWFKPQIPFKDDQKPFYSALLIRDPDDWQLMLIDQNDDIYFRNKLVDDRKTEEATASTRRRKLAVLDTKHGLVIQGKNRLDHDEMNTNDCLILRVQAKLLAGEIKYSSKELETLAHLSHDDRIELRDFIYNVILNSDSRKQRLYNRSSLGSFLGLMKQERS
jgi:hypothetical protein